LLFSTIEEVRNPESYSCYQWCFSILQATTQINTF